MASNNFPTEPPSILHEPTPTPVNGDDAIAFQPRGQQEVRRSNTIFTFCLFSLLLILLVVRFTRGYREANRGATIFNCSSRRRRRAQQEAQRQRQLEVQQTAQQTAQHAPLSAQEIFQRTQKRRDAYLDTFQRNQVQLTIQKEDMITVNSDSLGGNMVQAAVVDDADHDIETEQVQEDIETGETTAASKTSSGRADGWQQRTIQSGCAICLDPYEVGDDIVWSSNEQCRHAFHQECVLDYFLHLHQYDKEEDIAATLSGPCPCCRQSFCQPRFTLQKR